MPPKRILMTSDTVGGVWTYSLALASRLAGYSIDVHLATMGPRPSRIQKRQLKRLSNVHLHESNYRLEWMEDPWDDVNRAGNWLLGLEKQFKPDIIHLNGYVHGVLPWAAPTCMVAHSCVLSWWGSRSRRVGACRMGALPDRSNGGYSRRQLPCSADKGDAGSIGPILSVAGTVRHI